MPTLTDPHRLHRRAAGSCLIAAPLLYIAGVVADPALRLGDPDAYGKYPDQVSLSAAVLHWSWVLLIPGIIGMIHLVRGRHVRFGWIAGGVALLGVVNFSALMLGDYFYATLEREFGPDEGSRLAEEALGMAGATFGFQIPGFLGLLGVLVLGLVLAKLGHAPWWASTALVAGVFVAPMFPIGTVAGGLLYLAGSGSIGLRMLRMTDEEWSGSPSGSVAVTA